TAAFRSARSLTKYKTVKMNERANRFDPVIAAMTWILIQYELSAGTSGPAGAYTRRADASARTPPPSTKPPTWRNPSRRSITRRYVITMRKPSMFEYSNMFPHGTRWTDKPRVAIDAACVSAPPHAIAVAIEPTRLLLYASAPKK